MLDQRYLTMGLDALSRAHTTHYFTDGHRGAATISAHFLCAGQSVEDGVSDLIASIIDEQLAQTDLCAPFPAEPAKPELLERITSAMAANIGPLRQAGHNVIFPSLALKAFAQVPEAVTPSRVEGICALIEAFDTQDDIELTEEDQVLDLGPQPAMAEFILSETLRTMQAFDGRGQGWSGHMLTHGRAVIDLLQLGYTGLARQAYRAFALYVKRTRMGPLGTDKPRPEHARSELTPLETRYWEARRGSGVGLGHCFKYPYGFYGLMRLAQDNQLKARCLSEAYRVF